MTKILQTNNSRPKKRILFLSRSSIKNDPDMNGIDGIRSLINKSVRNSWIHKRLFIPIVLLGQIPAALMIIVAPAGTAAGDTSPAAAYAYMLLIVMYIILLFSVSKVHNGETLSPRDAYYVGSKFIVRFILVGLVIGVITIPLLVGLVLFTLYALQASYNYGGLLALPVESTIVGLICLVIASISIWLLVRYSTAIPVLIHQDNRPVEALKLARRNTIGFFWPTLLRLFVLAVAVAVPTFVIVYMSQILGNILISNTVFFGLIGEILAAAIVLPFAANYLTLLANQLGESKNGRTK